MEVALNGWKATPGPPRGGEGAGGGGCCELKGGGGGYGYAGWLDGGGKAMPGPDLGSGVVETP